MLFAGPVWSAAAHSQDNMDNGHDRCREAKHGQEDWQTSSPLPQTSHCDHIIDCCMLQQPVFIKTLGISHRRKSKSFLAM